MPHGGVGGGGSTGWIGEIQGGSVLRESGEKEGRFYMKKTLPCFIIFLYDFILYNIYNCVRARARACV